MSQESANTRNDRRHSISDEAIVETMLGLAQAAGTAGSTGPNDVARSLAGENWQTLTGRVRQTAVNLAKAGRLVVLRKGKPVDPTAFKGVYRLRIADGAAIATPPETDAG